jgi:hypothetical protein
VDFTALILTFVFAVVFSTLIVVYISKSSPPLYPQLPDVSQAWTFEDRREVAERFAWEELMDWDKRMASRLGIHVADFRYVYLRHPEDFCRECRTYRQFYGLKALCPKHHPSTRAIFEHK